MKSTREKIVVGLTVLALLYFFYDFFLVDQPREQLSAKSDAAVQAVAADLRRELTGGGFDPPERLIAALGTWREASWAPEKFVAPDFILTEEPDVDGEDSFALEALRAAADDLVYSGYLEMGGRRLAVINGREYAVGDTVNDNLRLQRINASFLEVGLDDQTVRVPIADQQ